MTLGHPPSGSLIDDQMGHFSVDKRSIACLGCASPLILLGASQNPQAADVHSLTGGVMDTGL